MGIESRAILCGREPEKLIGSGLIIRFINRYIFKCIDSSESIWSVRITRSHRALGVMEGDTVTWFWIGNHDDYERFY
jgi:hypothetical protein